MTFAEIIPRLLEGYHIKCYANKYYSEYNTVRINNVGILEVWVHGGCVWERFIPERIDLVRTDWEKV